ncbi:hypothetical protein CEXT_69301 [Caerostris extrusa]|uniref:Uncharacterized protein n=1 Tax=Caerostris extrusa TaxID=172846 RepID=A0AAV4P8A2_CAEEX|nr:hypothetical protein CEXT_69301 [Caerostris extrusa]
MGADSKRVRHTLALSGSFPPVDTRPPPLSPRTTTTRLLGRRVWLRCGDEKAPKANFLRAPGRAKRGRMLLQPKSKVHDG